MRSRLPTWSALCRYPSWCTLLRRKEEAFEMFWGLKLEGGNRYSQLVEKPFHISHAVIAPTTSDGGEDGPVFPQMLIEIRAIVEKTDYIICYLDPTHDLLQQPLDLNISEGEEIVLYCSCNGCDGSDITVYLTGYFIEEPVFGHNLDDLELTNDECSMSDLESGLEEDEGGEGEHRNLTRLLFQDSFVSDTSDEEFVVSGKNSVPSLLPSNEEVGEESKSKESKTAKKKRKKKQENLQQKPGKRKREDGKSEDQTLSEAGSTPSPKKKKKQSSKRKEVKDEETSSSKPKSVVEKLEQPQQSSISPPKKSQSKAIKLKGGTEIQDIEVGSGKVAKPGRKVFVRYKGVLANSKVFDSNVDAAKPFMFKLGQGEVIKGWDEGVRGMQVGGKRKLTVPPKQGYGASGAPPDIPPHAKLFFDVELVDVS